MIGSEEAVVVMVLGCGLWEFDGRDGARVLARGEVKGPWGILITYYIVVDRSGNRPSYITVSVSHSL